MKEQMAPFQMLAAARREELKGWSLVAALLYEFQEQGVVWYAGVAENATDALSQPEVQLSPTTADQYRRVYKNFHHISPKLLETVRPRLLAQACDAIEDGLAVADEVLADAQVLSWSAFVMRYPRRSKRTGDPDESGSHPEP